MSYIHKADIENNLIEHWCNDVGTELEEGYFDRVYLVHKVGTEEYYPSPVDLPNEIREAMGLEPYIYEPTEIPIPQDEEEPENGTE